MIVAEQAIPGNGGYTVGVAEPQYVTRQIRWPVDVQEGLKEMADAEERSVNGQLVYVLRKAIAEWRAERKQSSSSPKD